MTYHSEWFKTYTPLPVGRVEGNYKMNFQVTTTVSACAARPKSVPIEVWHQRLGHTNYETVKRMINENHVSGLICANCNPPEFCEACILGKMTRKSFETSFERATEPGELIHSILPAHSRSGQLDMHTFFLFTSMICRE